MASMTSSTNEHEEKKEQCSIDGKNAKDNKNAGIASKLARSNILELHPYRCARDDYSDGILLDANENSFGPTSLPNNSLDPFNNSLKLERYPDPYQLHLKQLLCKYRGHNLRPANIFVGVGSDEAIDLLMRIFCKPSCDKILITSPTYGMYKVCAKVNDVQLVDVPLTTEFQLQIPEMLSTASSDSTIKLMFICSPGNPTACSIPLEHIEKIASTAMNTNPSYIIVVDEAYVDFSSKGSAIALINKYSNIVVLQTLSKAFGLAGVRCGFCIGSPDVIQLMNNVKAPYNVNSLTSETACNALSLPGVNVLDKHITTILQQRESVANKLNESPYVSKVFPSDSNFLLFRLNLDLDAKEIYKIMADTHGIVTRYRGSELHCDNCIRVTIGTEEENKQFFDKLSETCAKKAPKIKGKKPIITSKHHIVSFRLCQ